MDLAEPPRAAEQCSGLVGRRSHQRSPLRPSLHPPGEVEPLNDPEIIRERFEHQLEGVIDAGACALEATTVVDLTTMGNGDAPTLIRKGLGLLSGLGL